MAAASSRSVRVILSAQVNDFTSKIGQAKASVETLVTKINQVSQTQAWSDASTDLLKMGVTLSSVGVIAAKMAADFDEQMSAVSATGSDARQNLDQLRTAAIQAGAEFGQFTATEAADGITQLAKAGMSAADILSGGLRGSLAMAASGQMAVADAAELTAMTLTQFSLSGDKASHVADLLAAGAGKAVGDVADLGQALSNGGSVAAQYGISVEETVGVLAMFAQNALVGAEAGTAMKSMLMQLAKPTKEAQQTLDQYGISIYDAQGNFVGMESLAGQLKSQLGGLSQEQQNAAMSTIFGSYAIRAANILYKEGAEGVAHWANEVNDSGFAMTQAAALTDNLKGDIAELGGAFETAMIQVGSNAQSSLRVVVQGLTAIIEIAGQYPGVTTAIIGFATALGAVALTAGLVMKLTTAIAAFKTSLDVLKISMQTFTLGAGAIGLALAALGAVLGLVAKSHMEGKARVEGFTAALQQSGDAAATATREQAALQLQQAGALDVAEKYGIALSDVVEASLGNVAAQARVEEKLKDVRSATAEAMAAMDDWGNVDPGAQEKAAEISLLDSSIKKTGDAYSDAADKAKQMENATKQTSDASGTAKGAQNDLGNEIQATTDEINQQIQAATELTNLLNESGNAALTLSSAEMGLEKAYRDAAQAITENGVQIDINTGKIDINTEKGMKNQQALDNVASALIKNREAMIKNGASTQELNEKTESARAEFLRIATQMGINETEAIKMADAYGLVPTEIKTSALFNNQSAYASLDAYKNRLNELDGRRVTSYAETIYIQSGNKTLMYATGGAVRGPGTSTSDSIPALLSDGEHVLTAREVQALGGHNAVLRLRALALAGAVPKFASGGPVKYAEYTPSHKTSLAAAQSQTQLGGSARGGVNLTINYPIAEPTSKTIATAAAHFGMGI